MLADADVPAVLALARGAVMPVVAGAPAVLACTCSSGGYARRCCAPAVVIAMHSGNFDRKQPPSRGCGGGSSRSINSEARKTNCYCTVTIGSHAEPKTKTPRRKGLELRLPEFILPPHHPI